MLGIPFLTRQVAKPDQKSASKDTGPARLDKNTGKNSTGIPIKSSHPVTLTPPLANSGDEKSRARLSAAKALMVMGRHIEALNFVEAFLDEEPESVEGMITAGMIAGRMRQVAMAQEWFGRAAGHLTGRAKELVEPLLKTDSNDLSEIEDLIAESEAHPEDRERALAAACMLGKSGHFRAVERFIPIFD